VEDAFLRSDDFGEVYGQIDPHKRTVK